uniref:AP1 n=1 Tax=Ganoderma boninense TaxID=34458 RepID=A0A5K1K1M1_9APHY|nr:AP1 [Ganoderma boninense]
MKRRGLRGQQPPNLASKTPSQPSSQLIESAPIQEHYNAVKARYPGEGRRKWRLRVANAFWSLSSDEKTSYLASISQNPPSLEDVEDADFSMDDDPFDDVSDNAPGLGILLRTDYTNEDAWQVFYARLQDAEAELASETLADLPSGEGEGDNISMGIAETSEGQSASPSAAAAASATPTDAEGDSAMDETGEDEDADEGDGDGGLAAPVFFVVNAVSPDERAKLTGISNLTALRLLNDVDVRRAPAPPRGTKRIRPPNRLVDHDGWQEVYVGKTVWVYDEKSNQDQSVRLISQRGTPMYGTATGDSWRARVSHICELQVNLATGALTIDFGGLDRWDYVERARNLEEAATPAS